MTHQNSIDKWLMRGKDLLVIIAALGSFFLFVVKYYSLPAEVQAHAEQIETQNQKISDLALADMRISARLDQFELKQDYTNKGVDRIENWLKNVSNRTRVNQ